MAKGGDRSAASIDREIRALASFDAASVRGVRRRASRAVAKASGRDVLALGLELFERYGHRFVACELICMHPEARAALRATHVKRLGAGMDGWAAVDTFGSLISGQAWREGQVSDSLIHGWARSRDRWWRRAALVSTVPLNVKARGGTGDTPRTLAVCRLLLDDRDDMVVKALSWALRCLAERDAVSVGAFLDEHGDGLAARVRREVRQQAGDRPEEPARRRRRQRPSYQAVQPPSTGSTTPVT